VTAMGVDFMPVFFGWWLRWSYVRLVSVEPGVLSTDIYLGFQRRLQFAKTVEQVQSSVSHSQHNDALLVDIAHQQVLIYYVKAQLRCGPAAI
jgi:hypothetical protein